MIKPLSKFLVSVLLATPVSLLANGHITVIPLLQSISFHIINPLIVLLFAVALVYFLWGVFKFVAGAGDEEARSTGKQHMIWGIVGLFIMVGVYGILILVLQSLGIDHCVVYLFC